MSQALSDRTTDEKKKSTVLRIAARVGAVVVAMSALLFLAIRLTESMM